ncbi:MAG: VWA domain-containing protein [Thermoguttaceae bacterium]
MRKLPVYLVVDVSESMIGDAQRAVYKGIVQMLGDLRRNPYALETVWVSVLTFSTKAKVHVPLTELVAFNMPDLELQPGTALGGALRLLKERIEAEVRLSTAETKGDWRPLVFFLTDGVPTDNWREALAEFKKTRPRPARICSIACGEDVDCEILREIGDHVFRLVGDFRAELSDLFANLFVWLSASVASASASVGIDADEFSNVPLPKGIHLLKEEDEFDTAPLFPKCFYLHSICARDRKKFLTRFTFDGKCYNPTQVFKLPAGFSFEQDEDESEVPEIPAELINEAPICPYCGEIAHLHCPVCGIVFCTSHSGPVECPGCGTFLVESPKGSSGGFQITGGLG